MKCQSILETNSILPRYPTSVDDNVVRSVASLTFFLSIVMAFEVNLQYLVLPLFFDFVLRWIHPKYSPFAQVNKYININLLHNNPKLIFAPPKRFAILIGVALTGLMSVSYLGELAGLYSILLLFLIIASGLQSWFDYCLGCEVYDLLVKARILGRGEGIQDFNQYLISINGDSDPQIIQKELEEIALQDGQITEEEGRLIDFIVGDIHRYDEILSEAVVKGSISYEQKRELWHDRAQIARRAQEIAISNGKISKDEEKILTLLYDLLQEKFVIARK